MFLSENSGSRWRIRFTVSSITVSVLSPRKSIFSSPRSFSGSIGYWVSTSLPFTSRQSGMYSVRSRSAMTTPAACIPALWERASRIFPYSTSCFVCDLTFELGIFFRCVFERNIEFVRDHPRNAVGITIRQTHHAADIAHHAFRFQLPERDDLRDAAFAIFLPHVLEDFAAACLAKIDVDVRRRHAIRIEETLEE